MRRRGCGARRRRLRRVPWRTGAAGAAGGERHGADRRDVASSTALQALATMGPALAVALPATLLWLGLTCALRRPDHPPADGRPHRGADGAGRRAGRGGRLAGAVARADRARRRCAPGRCRWRGRRWPCRWRCGCMPASARARRPTPGRAWPSCSRASGRTSCSTRSTPRSRWCAATRCAPKACWKTWRSCSASRWKAAAAAPPRWPPRSISRSATSPSSRLRFGDRLRLQLAARPRGRRGPAAAAGAAAACWRTPCATASSRPRPALSCACAPGRSSAVPWS